MCERIAALGAGFVETGRGGTVKLRGTICRITIIAHIVMRVEFVQAVCSCNDPLVERNSFLPLDGITLSNELTAIILTVRALAVSDDTLLSGHNWDELVLIDEEVDSVAKLVL